MRRINPLLKEAINTARYVHVRDQELFDAYVESVDSDVVDEELLDKLDAMIDESVENKKQALFILLTLEANEVTDNFGMLDQSPKAGSAFPWEDVNALPQSLNEYLGELVNDIFDATDIPSVQIADEFEVWLDSLWNYYENR